MPEQTTNRAGGDDFGKAFGGMVIAAVAIALVFIAIYLAIFAAAGGAFYFGLKLGTYPWWKSTEPYDQVRQLEAVKREHLKALKGESEEIQGLAEEKFEDQKRALYRPKDDTHQPPHREMAMEFAKAAMKHLAAALFKRKE